MAPLSNHEQEQLRLLEKQFHTEDPKFVKNMRSMRSGPIWSARPQKHNILFNVTGLILGIGMFISGIAFSNAILFFLGFLVTAVAYYRTALGFYWAKRGVSAAPATPSSAPRTKAKSAFMANLERQWDERKKNDP